MTFDLDRLCEDAHLRLAEFIEQAAIRATDDVVNTFYPGQAKWARKYNQFLKGETYLDVGTHLFRQKFADNGFGTLVLRPLDKDLFWMYGWGSANPYGP